MFGVNDSSLAHLDRHMTGSSPAYGAGTNGDVFDAPEAFVPDHLPDPGPTLYGHELLTGNVHVVVHQLATELFEERGVYDVTFGYNLARLNLDRRHPDSGYRYAVHSAEPSRLLAEFTPTTPFCPQVQALTEGSFRAWNGLYERHEYDLVAVRVHPMHQQSEHVNERLRSLEEQFLLTGLIERSQ